MKAAVNLAVGSWRTVAAYLSMLPVIKSIIQSKGEASEISGYQNVFYLFVSFSESSCLLYCSNSLILIVKFSFELTSWHARRKMIQSELVFCLVRYSQASLFIGQGFSSWTESLRDIVTHQCNWEVTVESTNLDFRWIGPFCGQIFLKAIWKAEIYHWPEAQL